MTTNWLNRERVIHEKLFDTLSRPLSRVTNNEDLHLSHK
uniref:Uncharacterized protein n=1 Tax=Heterorhabditis bacteriophora TaxID=37862 RepID=A0A1I7WCP2_HETBA